MIHLYWTDLLIVVYQSEIIECKGHLVRKYFNFAEYFIFTCLLAGLELSVRADGSADTATEKQDNVLQFLHEEYPPYVYVKDGVVVGTVADLTTEIVSRAGYALKWRGSNYRRLIRELQLSDRPLCAAAYSGQHNEVYDVLASRQFAWFPGSALAVRKSDVHLLEKHKSLVNIMNDTSLRGAFLMGAQYFGVSEDVRAGRVERHILISSSDIELGLLVGRGRVHFAVMNPDEVNYLMTEVPAASNLTVFKATGMAPPRQVGFICSKATAAETMQRLNEAIAPLPAYETWEQGVKKATQ